MDRKLPYTSTVVSGSSAVSGDPTQVHTQMVNGRRQRAGDTLLGRANASAALSCCSRRDA
eukprot:297846-Chlamydomonas_euryale.AAC.9